MATRAFLLCGDEKAVQAVTQILDELEVSFEHSSEPAFSLKRLATQRFDLLIVDCDNAQNATQVFNSARASNLNKTSIAIAIVEGKAGVPNAFRFGCQPGPYQARIARTGPQHSAYRNRDDAQGCAGSEASCFRSYCSCNPCSTYSCTDDRNSSGYAAARTPVVAPSATGNASGADACGVPGAACAQARCRSAEIDSCTAAC